MMINYADILSIPNVKIIKRQEESKIYNIKIIVINQEFEF
jgi:hypothetical protein